LREKTGRSLYVSINVSTSQLLEKDFALRLGERLRTNELPGDALLLEITESVFAADAATVRNTLGEVRHLGVPVALDDFGTGYSSLGYLNRLPVDRVKIDKSFLAPLARGEGAPVAAAVLALARNLGLSVVAEGVETDFQRRWLRARGCRFGQGWFFAKALEEAAAVEYAFRERIPDKPEAAS
jgi:sensor c-di-GMP phosphodiesterase-like protein